MPDWLPALMGPGGAMVAAIIFGRVGFKFLTELITKQTEVIALQDDRFADLCKEFRELNAHTLDHIAEQTLATNLLTKALEDRNAQRREPLKAAM